VTAKTARIEDFQHGRVPRELRERQLLELAEELFGERGYAGASMDELARRAGVTKPVVYELFGSKDSVSVGLGPRTPIRSVEPGVPAPAGPAWPDFLDRFRAAYAAELATFVRVANGDEPSPCTERDGVEALRIAEAATRSLHEHRPVRLEEIPA